MKMNIIVGGTNKKLLIACSSSSWSLSALRFGRLRSPLRLVWDVHRPKFRCFANKDDTGKSATELHQLFMNQIEELNLERHSLFGKETKEKDIFSDLRHSTEEALTDSKSTEASEASDSMEDWKKERDAVYGFTAAEQQAWSVGKDHAHKADHLQQIEEARQQLYRLQDAAMDQIALPSIENNENISFTHVAQDGATICMVDVGSKTVTHRTAVAQSVVVFPETVLAAFSRQPQHVQQKPGGGGRVGNDMQAAEWVGPKGPIFATAITAGIMASKQTSSLIPLCHPLPLEKVHIDISWRNHNSIRIECTCSVSHKTGVEMEALMGASVAALTVYDMVKAVSHDVQIVETQLTHKDGGKRSFNRR